MDLQGQNGLMTTYRQGWRSRGALAFVAGGLLLAFYLLLYFTQWFEPVARALHLPNKWYLYGALYCVAMTGGAVYYLRRHGNSRYNRARIGVNLAVQYLLAFLLPLLMTVMGSHEYYFSYLWPLKIEYLYPSTIFKQPFLIVLYSFLASLIAVPLLTVGFGKRWYCSWVCGCGALANTFGDPWRHLGNKSTKAWRFEQVSIYGVLGLAVATTGIVTVNWAVGQHHPAFSAFAFKVQEVYGLVVGMALSGIVGVAAYPIWGARVWCRFFCPMAALLGLLQKLGRFRIAVKRDMCISCGNCSTYCEMGIDVRAYAQSNEAITRAACVGCGMCAHLCPRGVLKLENRWPRARDKARQGLPVVDF